MAKNPITDGTHEDHVRAGEQSHKTTASASAPKGAENGSHPAGTQGGTHEQHVKAGQQSHSQAADAPETMHKEGAAGAQGGTHEQHVKAGHQSHKSS